MTQQTLVRARGRPRRRSRWHSSSAFSSSRRSSERAAFESRLPATERERAPLPNSKLERDIVGRFAETVENGDVDARGDQTV